MPLEIGGELPTFAACFQAQIQRSWRLFCFLFST